MKLTKNTETKLKPGMTLIEITVVILVLLTLISVLFIGASIYKRGADRAACILNIRNVHQAIRADQNLNAKIQANPTATPAIPGDAIQWATEIYSSGGVERYLIEPTCPTDGGNFTEVTNPFRVESRHPLYADSYEASDGDYMSNYYMWLLIDEKGMGNQPNLH